MSEHVPPQSASCDADDSEAKQSDRRIAKGAKGEEKSAAPGPHPAACTTGAALDRSASSICHLSKLSADELQLALQWADAHSRLAAGRCCRSMRDAVRDPFAWRDASPFVVRSENAPKLAHSLLVHAPIQLVLSVHGGPFQPDDLSCLSDLRVLDACDWPCDLQQWDRLIALPVTQQLQEIRMIWRTGDAVAMLPAACRLPALRRLECGFAGSDPSSLRDPEFPHYYNDYLTPLSAAPALEELTLHQAGLNDCLGPLGACRPLRALSLLDASMTADAFAALCASPGLHRLGFLALHGLCAGNSGTAGQWTEGFRALTQLRTLALDSVTGLAVLLKALAESSSPDIQLRLLRVTVRSPDAAVELNQEVLRVLLDAVPLLLIDIIFHSSSDCRAAPAAADEFWAPLVRGCTGMAPRVRFSTIPL